MPGAPGQAVCRVLIVEDDADHAELVRRGFAEQETAVEVTVIDDGEAALEYLRRGSRSLGAALPHLVLLDLRLPRLDGLQLLRQVKASPDLRGIPCVVLTTSDAERDMLLAHELHANSYLVKPGDGVRFARLIGDVERYWADSDREPLPAQLRGPEGPRSRAD